MTDSIRWFRLYAEIVDDEKLRLLAFEDRWHYIAILACKAQGIVDDAGPLLHRKMSVKLGLATRDFDAAIARLAEVGLIDGETLQPLAWDRRQYRSDHDPTGAERLRRFREKKRETDVQRVTDALRNGRVTPSETETETETETEKERGRASRLPAGFPDEGAIEWCEQKRPDLRAGEVAEKFRDYWTGVPGQRGRKLDWLATWRNFVRNERAAPHSGVSGRTALQAERARNLDLALGRTPKRTNVEVIDV